MNKRFVMRLINISADNRDARVFFFAKFGGRVSCNIAHRTGDNGDAMPALNEEAREFVVTCAAGFVYRGEGLVDEKNVHFLVR